MPHEVKLLLASRPSNGGSTIWTFRCRYWRAFHSEVMTHRDFNRNAGSSRAIPVEKMLDMVLNDTAGPSHWGQNERGMQAREENNALVELPPALTGAWETFDGGTVGQLPVLVTRERAWKFSAWLAAGMSKAFSDAGYHKQVSNRLTEPFQYINVVITATRWENFFALRAHEDAMPEFKEMAFTLRDLMIEAMSSNKIQVLKPGEWHVPYLLPGEDLLPIEVQLKLSTARCASVSYQTVDGKPMGLNKAEEVFHKLVGSDPKHASPTEHQARSSYGTGLPIGMESNLGSHWLQYRKFVETSRGLDQ